MRSLFVAGSCIWALSSLFTSCASDNGSGLELSNPVAEKRPDELIVLSRSFLETKLGSLADKPFVQIKNEAGEPLVVQQDDLDGDGKWDEAVFLYSFEPSQTVHLSITAATEPAAVKAVTMAHVRLRKRQADSTYSAPLAIDTMPYQLEPNDFSKVRIPYYQTEGPAWENDKVAFRLYLDTRNGKDIFGKTTDKMMMDTVGVEGDGRYHSLADWGMDILKAGQSLGAGAVALRIPMEGGRDSLVRLGGKNIGQTVYTRIADGPVRAIFRLSYNNWKVADSADPVTVTEDISIWGGQYFYQSSITVKGAPQSSHLVSGIVNLHSHEAHYLDTADCKALYTFDKQSENQDMLGMGILVHESQFAAFGEAKDSGDIQTTYTMEEKLLGAQPTQYRFYVGWERTDSRFSAASGFEQLLTGEAQKYDNPIQIQ